MDGVQHASGQLRMQTIRAVCSFAVPITYRCSMPRASRRFGQCRPSRHSPSVGGVRGLSPLGAGGQPHGVVTHVRRSALPLSAPGDPR
jgi:hypothetical protein